MKNFDFFLAEMICKVYRIDDYVIMLKMADQGRSDSGVVFFYEPLHFKSKQILIKFAFMLPIRVLRSYFKVTCEYELYSLPKQKLLLQRIMVKTA